VHLWLRAIAAGVLGAALLAVSGDQQIDLLIGTDPERAPMHVNRWGYASELTCAGQTQVVGLMTQSDEDTIQAATVSVSPSGGKTHQCRAVRGTIAAGPAETELLRVSTGDTEFETRNTISGEVTRFQVTSGTAATGALLTGVPLRVVYRPRWWLELELLLDGSRP